MKRKTQTAACLSYTRSLQRTSLSDYLYLRRRRVYGDLHGKSAGVPASLVDNPHLSHLCTTPHNTTPRHSTESTGTREKKKKVVPRTAGRQVDNNPDELGRGKTRRRSQTRRYRRPMHKTHKRPRPRERGRNAHSSTQHTMPPPDSRPLPCAGPALLGDARQRTRRRNDRMNNPRGHR